MTTFRSLEKCQTGIWKLYWVNKFREVMYSLFVTIRYKIRMKLNQSSMSDTFGYFISLRVVYRPLRGEVKSSLHSTLLLWKRFWKKYDNISMYFQLQTQEWNTRDKYSVSKCQNFPFSMLLWFGNCFEICLEIFIFIDSSIICSVT